MAGDPLRVEGTSEKNTDSAVWRANVKKFLENEVTLLGDTERKELSRESGVKTGWSRSWLRRRGGPRHLL